MNGKRNHEKVIRTAVCFPPLLWDFAEDYKKAKAYPSLSSMIQALLREKMEQSPRHQSQTPSINL